MVGLVAAIHGFMCKMAGVVDARHKAGPDDLIR
jgi:hypothetical protein